MRALPRATFDRLARHLVALPLLHHTVLFRARAEVRRVYFIDQGMVSLIQGMKDGRTVEVGAIGTEGAVGSNAVFGVSDALLETMVQMPGRARAVAPDVLAEEARRCHVLSSLLQGIVHIEVAQIAQTAACNRLHSLEQRCCRWLLTAHDNGGSDTFPLTQEFLAMMLGVRRPGVTVAARSLQQSGYIRYHRGQIEITDRKGLERASCECYAAIRAQSDALFRGT